MAKTVKKWIADSAIDTAKLENGAVTNAKVSATAAIAESKLALDHSTASLNTAIGTKISSSEKGAVSGVATLGADGKLTAAQVPAIAITETFVVATEAAMLALVCEQGDVAVRTDISKSLILKAEPATVLANWQELLTPVSPVSSVNGQTGAVVLDSGDVAEGTNKYFTDARAKAAAVANAIVDGVTDVAPSQEAVFTALALKADASITVNGHALSANVTVTKADVGLANVDNVQQLPMSYLDTDADLTANSDSKVASQKAVKSYVDAQISASAPVPAREIITVVAADVTNQYVTLAHAPVAASVKVTPVGGPEQEFNVDFDFPTTTRVGFKAGGDLAALIVAGDKLIIEYVY